LHIFIINSKRYHLINSQGVLLIR